MGGHAIKGPQMDGSQQPQASALWERELASTLQNMGNKDSRGISRLPGVAVARAKRKFHKDAGMTVPVNRFWTCALAESIRIYVLWGSLFSSGVCPEN